ncbi:MAG: phage major capsid protein [Clostridia bacterium]
MSITQAKDQLKNLRAKLHAEGVKGRDMAGSESATVEQMEAQRRVIEDLRARCDLVAADIAEQEGVTPKEPLSPVAPATNLTGGLRRTLASNEYAQAFAYAIRNGLNPGRATGSGDDRCRVLVNALTEAGGNPAGADGGFLVPEDIDRSIREMRRTMPNLASLVNVETVNTNSGWRVKDLAPTTGFTELGSEIPDGGVPMDDQPSFSKISYALATYGLIVPISRELLADEVANLMGYLSRWYGRKMIITENRLILTALKTLAAANFTTAGGASVLGQMKAVFNKKLDPAISATSTVLTNQDGFDYLDQLVDADGRPLLRPDPIDATQQRILGRNVHVVANGVLPSRTVEAAGATKGAYYPMFLGDLREYLTLFQRQGLEMLSTDVGGDAFRKNSVEVRGITRLSAMKFDVDACVFREIFIPES